MERDVVTFGLYPDDLVGAQDVNVGAGAHEDASRPIRTLRTVAAELVQQRHELIRPAHQILLGEIAPRAGQRGGELRRFERLEKIVDGVDSKGIERVLLIGCQEYYRRHAL